MIAREQTVRERQISFSDIGNAHDYVFAFPSVVAAHSLLVLLIGEDDQDGPGVTAVVDDLNGAWTRAGEVTYTEYSWFQQGSLWYRRDAVPGTMTVTVSFAPSSDFVYASIMGAEYSGVLGPLLAVNTYRNPIPSGADQTRRTGVIATPARCLFVAGFTDDGNVAFIPVGGTLGGFFGVNLVLGNDSLFSTDVSGYEPGDGGGGYTATDITRETPPVAPPTATYAMRLHSTVNDNAAAITTVADGIPVVGGRQYRFTCALLGETDGTDWAYEIQFYNADDAFLYAEGRDDSAGSASWNSIPPVIIQAPLESAYARVRFIVFAGFDATPFARDGWVTEISLEEKSYTWVWSEASLSTKDGSADALLFDRGVGTTGLPYLTSAEGRVATLATGGGNESVGGIIAAFGVEAPVPPVPPTPPTPPTPPAPTVKWQFFDPTNSDTATFLINPSEGGSPGYEKQFAPELVSVGSTGPDGAPVAFETSDRATELSVSGTILDEAEYEMFVTWFRLEHPVQLIDDLGRVFTIVISKFTPKRVWSGTVPWRHAYDLTALVLGQP